MGVGKVSQDLEPRLWRLSRRLRGPLARRIYTRDGHKLLLYAYQKGLPPVVAPCAWEFAPAPIGIIQYIYLYLRYKFWYRGAYVVDIREPDGGTTIARSEFKSRPEAVEAFEVAASRVETVDRDAVSTVIMERAGDVG